MYSMEITIKNPGTYKDIIAKIEESISQPNIYHFPQAKVTTLSAKTCYKCLQPIDENYEYIRAYLESRDSTAVVHIHKFHFEQE